MQSWADQLLGEDFLLIITRLLVALVLSGLIGFEREINNHSAGFRTHILVGVGACLMMILSLFGFSTFNEVNDNIRFDPARIPSYVISGIGFLGAGTIIVYGGTVRGLTTAASIWAVAGIGLVVGSGMYSVAIFTTLIILISLIFLNHIERIFPRSRTTTFIELVVDETIQINQVVEVIEKQQFSITNIEIIRQESSLRKFYIKMGRKDKQSLITIFEEISRFQGVKNISELTK
ncbi:MgtC/SapB family protein [Oceanobacillus profundus]|uniref:MgtC/SapB family protein n=1 Tax=Oceanobacillus TaxID=182709 RepID=UPI001F006613|nr:MgtC/SapB family protein [Oceanobacillus profundus]MCM3399699.1 MgtC/SapB family protein [Oceanobacillus profundus]MDO6451070.1 MgtC/SapB family protein [Oceanobacillus profundus]